MPTKVAILDLLCEREVYGPKGNAAAMRPFGEVDILALNPQLPSLEGWQSEGDWGGLPFHRVPMPSDVEAWFDDGVAALIISGSRSNLTMHESWMDEAADFVRRAVEHGVPTLGICFGHQLLAAAFGGRLQRAENGFHDISTLLLTSKGEGDPLFEACERPPQVVFTHQDQVVEIPGRFQLLAEAEHVGIAAFRICDEEGVPLPAWGVQFHPESTAEICRYASQVEDMPFKEDDPRIEKLAGERILANFAELSLV
ncbi:MAG: type 1 glutamine amidotransferase [Candidatus Poseidoniaceae archaeon]|jgi:GMP synthase-like glutamine amidotransferase|nr:type 1 glutamine amidotransferase [Candidatus Poseidoniaceae archaeon]MDP7203356.1 type 1 glutamine amidotransferase [Candidatus Poseidoniaceae archaeon]